MINKFQQGGKQDVIMQFIQGLAQTLQADPNQIIQIAQQNPKALEAAVQTYQQTQDMNQAAQAFQQGIQAARHGAKLNYIKSLKHQCADDEELYYYKKGGSIGCGCKKKEGGEIKDENKKESPIAKFKARNGVKVPDDKKILPTDTVHIQNPKTKKMEVRDLSGKHKQFKKLTKEEYQKQSNDKKNDIDTKGYKKGGKTEKDCGGASIVKKFKAARCGSKIKKHQYGGSLNGIPFMQGGTPKGSVEKSDNTRVQKPIPGIISPDSEVRIYDNIPVRVNKYYPWQDKYYLGNPARPMYSHDKNVKLNAIYPGVHGVELDVLAPEYIQKISGNDTTYYVQGGDKNYYPVAGQQGRPAFREAFKNPKVRTDKPNYFDTPEKIDKVKKVINGWKKRTNKENK